MREIKFRGYDKDREEWRVGSLDRDLEQKCYYITDEYEGIGRDVVENSIGQFTGLHDKNGKEIYEGDIVKLGDTDTAIVEWNKEYASFILKPIQDYYFDSDILGHAVCENEDVIIGNIYKNPELLEV